MALESASPYIFNPKELWTLGIAAYAAVISTFVLGWDAYKWLASGAKIEISASTGMKMIGGYSTNTQTYISITAWNVGDQPTTITNLGCRYFDSWWRAYISRRRPVKAFIITEPSQAQRLPYRFDVGDQWIGLAEQTNDIVKMATNGYLFITLFTARGGRGHRIRIRMHDSKE